jgi:tetratricopeptide (TPR) repeat protein
MATILLGAFLMQVVVLAPVVRADEADAKKSENPKAATPTPEAKTTGPAAQCNKDAAAIRKIYKTIPTDFRNRQESIEVITARVVDCKTRLEQFLESCSGSLKGNEDVYPMLTRMVVALSAQERQGMRNAKVERSILVARMREYYKRMIVLSEQFRSIAPKDHPLQGHVWRQTGDGHYYRQEFNEAIEIYKKVLDQYPTYEERGPVILGLLRCYVNAQNATEGRVFARKVIKEEYRRSDLPHYYELLWKLHTIAGDLEAMLALTEEVERIFPIRMIRKGAKPREVESYRRYLGYNGFRRGYCHFALGNPGLALDGFTKHIEEMDALRETLDKKGNSVPPELDVYSKRSSGNIRFLQNRHGHMPKTGLENIVWATGEPVSYEDAKQGPLAIVFRNIGETRSAKFLKELDVHAGKNPDLFKLVVLSFTRRSGANADAQAAAEEALVDAVELGLRHTSVGIDPDARTENPNVFEACQALIGSATFVILDREGRMRWWQQDPRDIDVEFSTAILGRIAIE